MTRTKTPVGFKRIVAAWRDQSMPPAIGLEPERGSRLRTQPRSLDLITEASAAATRMPDRAATQSAFSGTGVEVYQISIHNALGDSAAALIHASSVMQARLPTP